MMFADSAVGQLWAKMQTSKASVESSDSSTATGTTGPTPTITKQPNCNHMQPQWIKDHPVVKSIRLATSIRDIYKHIKPEHYYMISVSALRSTTDTFAKRTAETPILPMLHLYRQFLITVH